jgi:hypothetical protein
MVLHPAHLAQLFRSSRHLVWSFKLDRGEQSDLCDQRCLYRFHLHVLYQEAIWCLVRFFLLFLEKIAYGVRWEKYNYLTEAGFDVGIAISGLIQTLIFAFSNGGEGISLTWWGNTVATQVCTLYRSRTLS